MKPSHDLFHLIRAMKKSEKRYFKLSVSVQKGEKNYIRLFNAIDGQKEYNEKKIAKKFENEKFARQLPVAKNALYGLVLKSLRAYHAGNTSETDLYEQLHEARILYEKGLYGQCRNRLSKAKLAAYRLEKHIQILDILKCEKDLARAESYAGKTNNNPDKILQEEKKVLDTYGNLCEFICFDSKIFVMHLNHLFTRSKREQKIYDLLVNKSLFRDEKNALSFQARIYYHEAHGFYLLSGSDFTRSYGHYKKLLSLLESNPLMLKENIRNYTATLHNITLVLTHLRKYREFMRYIKKLRGLPERFEKELSEDTKYRIFIRSYNLEYAMLLQKKDYARAKALISLIENGLGKFKRRVDKVNELLLIYKYACTYFETGEYSKSLHWINRILNDPDTGSMPDIHCFARILNLIVHYELGNTDLLEYIVKSTYRFLYKRKRLYKFETSVLNFIKNKLPKVNTGEELAEAFRELRAELKKILKDPYEKQVLEYFDFISWLDRKALDRA